jgi:hypothetical protein
VEEGEFQKISSQAGRLQWQKPGYLVSPGKTFKRIGIANVVQAAYNNRGTWIASLGDPDQGAYTAQVRQQHSSQRDKTFYETQGPYGTRDYKEALTNIWSAILLKTTIWKASCLRRKRTSYWPRSQGHSDRLLWRGSRVLGPTD